MTLEVLYGPKRASGGPRSGPENVSCVSKEAYCSQEVTSGPEKASYGLDNDAYGPDNDAYGPDMVSYRPKKPLIDSMDLINNSVILQRNHT